MSLQQQRIHIGRDLGMTGTGLNATLNTWGWGRGCGVNCRVQTIGHETKQNK